MAKSPPKTVSKGRALSRAGNSPGSPGQAVAAANKWREEYNYLRGLVMARAVALLEAGLMGDYPELQRVFALAEASNGTYVGLVERCLAPFSDFDWDIKTVEEDKLPAGATKEMADAQAVSLRSAYDALDNLQEAIEHLALADFRGYAHLQIQRNRSREDAAGLSLDLEDAFHLEPLPQWKFSRDGMFGDWFWNPEMRSTTNATGLGESARIGSAELPKEDFIVREVRVPIDRVGLKYFIYTSLAEKDYAGFIEIFGIPSGVVTMPQGVPDDKVAEYETAATRVAQGGSGAIPHGATYTSNDSPRSNEPFSEFLKYWQEQLILAGTCGKLTMLAESGSGTLAGGAHEDSFVQVAAARAKKISEIFQRHFDADVLRRKHAGEPVLAYFSFGAEEEDDISALFDNAVKAKNAGKQVNTEWLAEKTGYSFDEDPIAPPPGGSPFPFQNRLLNTAANRFLTDVAADLAPVLEATQAEMDAILQISDPTLRQQKTDALLARIDALTKDVTLAPESAQSLQTLIRTNLQIGANLKP